MTFNRWTMWNKITMFYTFKVTIPLIITTRYYNILILDKWGTITSTMLRHPKRWCACYKRVRSTFPYPRSSTEKHWKKSWTFWTSCMRYGPKINYMTVHISRKCTNKFAVSTGFFFFIRCKIRKTQKNIKIPYVMTIL